MGFLSRDEIDDLNEKACPFEWPTTEEVKLVEKQMHLLFPDRYRSKWLYHYTKPDVLEKWLSDTTADLWCTHYRYLNDGGEWTNGIEYLSEYLIDHGHCDLAEVIESLPEKRGCAPWICCFSEHEDRASMWGMYGDRKIGGYAVGFERETLQQLVDARNEVDASRDLVSEDEYWLLPCVYMGDKRLDKLIDYILKTAHADEDEHAIREKCGHQLLGQQLSRLFFLTLLIKDPSFDYEREWRLVLRRGAIPADFERHSEVSWVGRPYVRSCLFDKPLREYISRVIVSPCGSERSSIDFATMNYQRSAELRKTNSLQFELCSSGSSYRGD